MDTVTKTRLADQVLSILRSHEAELRAAGIVRLSLFGSVARGDDESDSDVDLVAEFHPTADPFGIFSLETRMAELLGRKVDLLHEPVEKARLQANIDRDRVVAF